MKQEIISFLSTVEDELYGISKYIYENSEESFHENKSCNYLTDLLNNHSFKIQKRYLNIDTAFKAEFGNGHPKICFLCQYDGIKDIGQIYGYNLQSAISISAALGLSKIISRLGGSVIVIGCPGEILGGSKLTMAHQGAFEDLDIVLTAQPYTETAASGTSPAVLPLEIKYSNTIKETFQNHLKLYSPIDSCMFTFNAVNLIIKGFDNICSIDSVDIHSDSKNKSISQATARFLLKTDNIKNAENIKNKIDYFMNSIEKLLNIEGELHIYDLPCRELISNTTLNRLLSHNLKEMGIIDMFGIKNFNSPLSLGNVSHLVPSVNYYINITKDKAIKYGTKDFALATQTDFAKDILIKTANALAITGLDLLEKESLISEAKMELSSKTNNLTYSLI